MSFKKGDVVQLKSGGPGMTVTGIVGEDKEATFSAAVQPGFVDGDVTVEYFIKDKLERSMFKATSIKLVEEYELGVEVI